MDTKICIKCGSELPATNDYFNKSSTNKYGLRTVCKSCDAEKSKRYYEKNKEKSLCRQKKYYEENRQKESDRKKKYYRKNIEKESDRKKKYRKENADVCRRSYQKRRSLKNSAPFTLTGPQWEEIKAIFKGKCAYCGKTSSLEQEHFIPLSKGGGHTIENIIPACKSCNSSKNNRDFFGWYPLQSFYSKERESFLLKHIEELSKESI